MKDKTHIIIKNISKIFTKNGDPALKDINLEIKEGEILVLLGSSGCGKSTLLRIIGGLEKKTTGEVFFYDQEISKLPPEKRDAGFVFQNYALFPTMTVRENITFGLKLRKKTKPEIKKKVNELLKMMDLEEFADRKPSQLSGGQQQRVAIARVLAIEPKVLLMDEPLTALDAKLKEHLRVELAILFRKLGITTIYVTHDQAEAMAIADRIAIMNKGVIEQIDTPEDIYTNPKTDFVVQFIGKINCLNGLVVNKDGKKYIDLGFKRIPYDGQKEKDDIKVFLRPEDIALVSDEKESDCVIKACIQQSVFLGAYCHINAIADGQSISFDTTNTVKLKPGEIIKIEIDINKLIII